MDPRTHAWRQQRFPPAGQLSACVACRWDGWCLGDRRHKCLFDRVADGCRQAKEWLAGCHRAPAEPSGQAVLDSQGDAHLPE
jgi:hypothetical protein